MLHEQVAAFRFCTAKEEGELESKFIGNAQSPDGTMLRLPIRAWQHICTEHPEMESYQAEIFETANALDLIAAGVTGELKAIKWFHDLHVGAKTS